MIWIKRLILAVPFLIAAVLTVLVSFVDQFHLRREHTAGYCFLFGAPWAWLLDHDWFGSDHSRWINSLIGYAVLLWIPALLYSFCLWLFMQLPRWLKPQVFNANREGEPWTS